MHYKHNCEPCIAWVHSLPHSNQEIHSYHINSSDKGINGFTLHGDLQRPIDLN